MGRLTLNILLSFAQFEREVTGERIRDKIAASKKKGMWMGGQPSLGYDVKDKKLIVNKAEAETVRHIFRRYVELKSVRLLQADLDAAGIVSKARTASDGSRYGQKPLARGALYLMLQNRIYRGETVHKDNNYPGEHEALVDEALWNEVQALLASNRVDRVPGTPDRQPSLLAGILFDAQGERMTPTHATKRGTRYRYYVSRSLLAGKAKDLGQRIPAAALEALVTHRIRDWLADPAGVFQAVEDVTPDAGNQKRLIERTKHAAAMWQDLKPNDRRALLGAIVARVQVFADRIVIIVDRMQATLWLMGNHDESRPRARASAESAGLLLTLTVPARLRRAGKEMRIVLEDGSDSAASDPSLLRLLIRANAIHDRLLADRSLTLEEIAKEEKMVASYATRLFRLTLLAPNIVGAILNGNQPPELTARKLMDDTRLPLDWNEQRRALGFA